MKKKIFGGIVAAGLMVFGVSTIEINEAQAEPNVIKCFCEKYAGASNCTVNGSQTLCAQSQPGGNISCSSFDGNCGIRPPGDPK